MGRLRPCGPANTNSPVIGETELGSATPSYNQMVLRPSAAVLLAILVLAGCRNELKSKDKVQEAIVSRLGSSSGLDLKSLDINTTSVTFDKNMAFATVAFHPKGDPSVNSGMTMKYTLEDRDGKWVVVKVSDSQGHGFSGQAPPGSDRLPPGHPSINPSAPAGSMPNAATPHSSAGDSQPGRPPQ